MVTDPSADTIAAIATAPGRGSVGIVRISGPAVAVISRHILGELPRTRHAWHTEFIDDSGAAIDSGIALYFRGPASFTGEDVLELQGHGGPVVLDLLLERVLGLGARLAEPGEFSRRAYLNDKLDLAQAEAIADLIDSQTRAAARAAVRSLAGAFSKRVHEITEAITRLRMYVEAAIDFPEEEIDFLADDGVNQQLRAILEDLEDLLAHARTGQLLRDGLTLVIAGRPNAGKSSLLNVLTGQQRAIVTPVPGTTRDHLREQIEIDGLPLHLVDTAGLRDSDDEVEREGIRRAREQIAQADHALWVFDEKDDPGGRGIVDAGLPDDLAVTRVCNKIDLHDLEPGIETTPEGSTIRLSAKTGAGIPLLRDHLKALVAYEGSGEGDFSARARHLDALRQVRQSLRNGEQALMGTRAGELLAEDLRQAQLALSSVTGEFTADDLLGEIFSSFCIGK
jgi:tRNA modification GTPase